MIMKQKKSAINARLNLGRKKQTPITFVLFAFLFG